MILESSDVGMLMSNSKATSKKMYRIVSVFFLLSVAAESFGTEPGQRTSLSRDSMIQNCDFGWSGDFLNNKIVFQELRPDQNVQRMQRESRDEKSVDPDTETNMWLIKGAFAAVAGVITALLFRLLRRMKGAIDPSMKHRRRP